MVSNRHPYLFSCGEDKQVKCWDLEYNKVRNTLKKAGKIFGTHRKYISGNISYVFIVYCQVIRHYHGHLSAVHDISLHPTIDVLVTCGRDSTARVMISIYYSFKKNSWLLIGETAQMAVSLSLSTSAFNFTDIHIIINAIQ